MKQELGAGDYGPTVVCFHIPCEDREWGGSGWLGAQLKASSMQQGEMRWGSGGSGSPDPAGLWIPFEGFRILLQIREKATEGL